MATEVAVDLRRVLALCRLHGKMYRCARSDHGVDHFGLQTRMASAGCNELCV